MDSRYGNYERDGVTISYWSKYTDDWKTMYFKVDGVDDLKAIKGLRRNNKYGYYTKRVVAPASTVKKLVETYSEKGNVKC